MNRIISFANKVANKVVRHTRWYKEGYWNGATKFWYDIPFNLDVVNVGSGAAVHAYNYEEVPLKARNWALAPQSLVYDYNILRNFSSYLRTGSSILITICPFSCLFVRHDKDYNLKYYTMLHVSTILDFEDAERTRALEMQKNPFGQAPWMCVKKTLKDVIKAPFLLLRKNNKDLLQSANNFICGWKQQFGISDLSAPISEEHKRQQLSRRDTLSKMVAFCLERGFNPIIIIPPMYHTLWQQFPATFFDNYINPLIEGIGAPLHNYMKSPTFDKEEFFDNSLFMSVKGAKVFTQQVLTDIGLIKV